MLLMPLQLVLSLRGLTMLPNPLANSARALSSHPSMKAIPLL